MFIAVIWCRSEETVSLLKQQFCRWKQITYEDRRVNVLTRTYYVSPGHDAYS